MSATEPSPLVRFAVHVLQALTIAALVGVAQEISSLNTSVQTLQISNTQLAAQFTAFQKEYQDADVPKMSADIVRLQDDDAYLERELNNYPPHDDRKWQNTHQGM